MPNSVPNTFCTDQALTTTSAPTPSVYVRSTDQHQLLFSFVPTAVGDVLGFYFETTDAAPATDDASAEWYRLPIAVLAGSVETVSFAESEFPSTQDPEKFAYAIPIQGRIRLQVRNVTAAGGTLTCKVLSRAA